MSKISKWDGNDQPKLRRRSDLGYLWFNQGRARMIKVCKDLGIIDVCECRDWNSADYYDSNSPNWRIRPNSGSVGMKECADCLCLIYPLSYVFPCDECTEPTLAAKHIVPLSEEFLCFDCQLEQMEGK